MVPTLTCGLLRSNFAFAILASFPVHGRSPTGPVCDARPLSGKPCATQAPGAVARQVSGAQLGSGDEEVPRYRSSDVPPALGAGADRGLRWRLGSGGIPARRAGMGADLRGICGVWGVGVFLRAKPSRMTLTT